MKPPPARFVWDADSRHLVAGWRAEGRRRYLDRLQARRLAPEGPSVAVVLDGVQLGIVSPRMTVRAGGRIRARSWGYVCHGQPGLGGPGPIGVKSLAVEACAVHAVEGAAAAKRLVSSMQHPVSVGRAAGAGPRRVDVAGSRPNMQTTPGATGAV